MLREGEQRGWFRVRWRARVHVRALGGPVEWSEAWGNRSNRDATEWMSDLMKHVLAGVVDRTDPDGNLGAPG